MNITVLLELVEDVILGRPTSVETAKRIHKALLRGDIIVRPAHQEELITARGGEELAPGVAPNLLQLLCDDRWAQPAGASSQTLASTSSSVSGQSQLEPNDCDTTSCERSLCFCSLPSDDGAASSSASVVAWPLQQQVDAVLATVDEWQFDAFRLTEVTHGRPLSTLCFFLIQRSGLMERFGMNGTRLARWLRAIEDGYPDNPYHNRTHAADVLQSVHVLMTRGGVGKSLGGDELCLLAAYFGATIHDFQHQGLNNDFLVRTGHDLALTYNDASPQENHHVAGAFRLLQRSDLNFLSRMAPEKRMRLRKLVVDMVLSTDMKMHFSLMARFQARMEVKLRRALRSGLPVGAPRGTTPLPTPAPCATAPGPPPSARASVAEDESDRSLILQMCLKCADVSHLSAGWEVHHRWVSCLEEEFFRQGDREKEVGMAPSPLMDRSRDGITKSQVGFFGVVALPLFDSFADVFSEALPLVQAAQDNCNHWRGVEATRCQAQQQHAHAVAHGALASPRLAATV